MADDPDPLAATLGSVLARFAKFRRLEFRRDSTKPVVIQHIEGGGTMRYPAQLAELLCEEETAQDLTLYDELDGVDLSMSVPAEAPGQPATLLVEDANLE